MAVKKKKITTNSSVRVQWNDKWENYSKEKQRDIIKHVKKKYGVSSVRVDFNATNKINLGVTNMETGDAENINTPEVQEKIITNWLSENKIDITLGDIKRLNKRVEARLEDFNNTKDNKWSVKKLTLENFLSYGEKTVFDFDKLKGISLISGKNFNGKSTVLNALVWLLFNTTDKTKVADEIINRYNGAEFAKVTGEIIIDGIEYQIIREVKRKYKKDRSSYTTSTTLKFLTKNPQGEYEELDKEEDRKATDAKLKEHIGSLNEFLMTVVCTGDNIFDIIKAKPTERGQLLSRFLGLEIFEKKEKQAKELYNEWKIKADIHKYSSIELESEVSENEKSIQEKKLYISEQEKELDGLSDEITIKKGEYDKLMGYYHNDIDPNISNLSEDHFLSTISNIENDINNKRIELNETKDKIKSDLEVFNESDYQKNKLEIENINTKKKDINIEIQNEEKKIREIENDVRDLITNNRVIDSELKTLRATIKNLREGDKCSECGQKLADVDHTDVINDKIAEGVSKKAKYDANITLIEETEAKIPPIREIIDGFNQQLTSLDDDIDKINKLNDELLKVKQLISENDIIKLKADNIEVQIEVLEGKIEKEKGNLESFKKDLSKIEKNKELDIELRDKRIEITKLEEDERLYTNRLTVGTTERDNLLREVERLNELIIKIKKEEHIAKVFEVYITMVGKNGISKTIMRNSIPVLNLELAKLLRESAEFTVEIEINMKNNEVEFWLVDNETGLKAPMISGSGYERTIGSLAIRVVNSKINTLPKPSLLLIDEIFSTVDNENLELVKVFIDKVATTIDNVIIITHNESVKEWADHVITITKENNVSKANF